MVCVLSIFTGLTHSSDSASVARTLRRLKKGSVSPSNALNRVTTLLRGFKDELPLSINVSSL